MIVLIMIVSIVFSLVACFQDDPSYFTFFFDTSRRLCCYLAPERFCTSQELNLHPNLPGEFMDVSKGLTHAMDIFSLGCVLAEMFSEGKCPFTYEMLVKYKFVNFSCKLSLSVSR